ncbi:DUF4419 domain-containing protein [Candidatus Uhrbacteria bacterium]|nr:DUF4419 domain-containing protein [Candidatus Uhrbacteria bacterium]
MLDLYRPLVKRITRPWRRLGATRSLALPPRTNRPTRIFTDPSVESRGRVSLVPPGWVDRLTAQPISAERVQTKLRETEERIAYYKSGTWRGDCWEWRGEHGGFECMGRKTWLAQMTELRQERANLLGIAPAAMIFPDRELRTHYPPAGQNGLLGSAIRAYHEHQGLVLAPEAFAATVAQSVARFIFEGDRATIPDDQRTELRTEVYPTGPFGIPSVAAVAEQLALTVVATDALAARLNGLLGHLRAAPGYAPLTDITLLAAFDARYRYISGLYACGIRRIEVEGAPDEWLRAMWMAKALGAMPELAPLNPWLTTVGEIAGRIAGSSPSDATSQRFVRGIVQFRTKSCAPSVASGWITNLFPYYEGKLRAEFPVEGGPELNVGDNGLNDHLLAKARVRIEPQPPCPMEPFDVQLVAGLDAIEEPCGDMHMYRPVPFHGIWAPLS